MKWLVQGHIRTESGLEAPGPGVLTSRRGQQARMMLVVSWSTDLLGLWPPTQQWGRPLILGQTLESRVGGKPGPSTFWASMSPTPTCDSNLETFITSAPGSFLWPPKSALPTGVGWRGGGEGDGTGGSVREGSWGPRLQETPPSLGMGGKQTHASRTRCQQNPDLKGRLPERNGPSSQMSEVGQSLQPLPRRHCSRPQPQVTSGGCSFPPA